MRKHKRSPGLTLVTLAENADTSVDRTSVCKYTYIYISYNKSIKMHRENSGAKTNKSTLVFFFYQLQCFVLLYIEDVIYFDYWNNSILNLI